MTLRQEQPIVARVFNQTAPGFHQPLLLRASGCRRRPQAAGRAGVGAGAV